MSSTSSNAALPTGVPARITLPASGGLKAGQVLSKLSEFEGRLHVVEKELPGVLDANNLSNQLRNVLKRVEVQEMEIEKLRAENKALKVDMEGLKAAAIDDNNGTTSGEDSESDEDCKPTIIEETVERSVLAYKDTAFKELTRYAFNHLMGIGKFTAESAPPYPADNNKETWPHLPGTTDPVLRFRWDKPWDHDDNFYSIRMIVGWMKRHGEEAVPASKKALLQISAEDHQQRVRERFTNLQRMVKEAAKGKAPEQVVDLVDETEDGGAGVIREEPQIRPTTTLATLRSRAAGKLKNRLVQRDKLPADSPWRHEKYDAAFVATLMSDDEDEYDENGKATNRFISRAPLYRSEEMKKLLEAIDSVPLDKSKRFVSRVRGDLVDVPPKTTKKLEFRARRWMVDEEWLAKEENEKWDVDSRIAESGKAWGDEEDPEVIVAKREEIKLAKKALATEKKRRLLDIEKERESKKAKKTNPKKGYKGRNAHAVSNPGGVDGDDEDILEED
ncbi:hypothetical protein H0H92_003923 [Tricholoma furcatifolium]|nr:hypothetical protein H0H92_003923 [Tricholoma furcatifolium]